MEGEEPRKRTSDRQTGGSQIDTGIERYKRIAGEKTLRERKTG